MPKRIDTVSTMEDIIPLIRENLDYGKSVRIFPMGSSMLPMLRQGKDSVVLSPVSGKLKRFDIPLYQRKNGKYVLHRIVEDGETYACMGDNQFVPERGIEPAQVIAVVTEFYRDGTKHTVEEPGYRIYCGLWYCSRHVRRFYRRVKNWIRRHLK